jgi:hypothetical protein
MSTNRRSVKITNETLFGFHDKILDLSLPQPGFHFSGSCSSLGADREARSEPRTAAELEPLNAVIRLLQDRVGEIETQRPERRVPD